MNRVVKSEVRAAISVAIVIAVVLLVAAAVPAPAALMVVPAMAAVAPALASPRRRGKSERSLQLIRAAREILAEIQPATVRAVCYRLFALGLTTSMARRETNRVSTQLTWARERGLIPWTAIVDETRDVEQVATWADPHDYAESVLKSFRLDRWEQQPAWIEVWSEKGTVRGTLKPVLDQYGVAFRVMHGFGSATAVYQAAKDSMQRVGKVLGVLYVGDFDPSGLYMSEHDLPTRLERYDGFVEIQRLALTTADTRSGLPSFPADSKAGDPRYRWFRERHGATCWELDSLSPVELRRRIEQAIRQRLDMAAWERAEVAERAQRESLVSILSAWPLKARQVSKYPPRRVD